MAFHLNLLNERGCYLTQSLISFEPPICQQKLRSFGSSRVFLRIVLTFNHYGRTRCNTVVVQISDGIKISISLNAG